MLTNLYAWFQSLLQTNIVFSGAAGAALMAAASAYFYIIVKHTWRSLISLFTIEIQCKNDSDIYKDLNHYLVHLKLIGRRVQIEDCWVDGKNSGSTTLSVGVHYFMLNRRPLIVIKSRPEHENTTYLLAENLTLIFLFRRDKKFVQDFITNIIRLPESRINIRHYTGYKWETIATRSKRTFDSIVLPPDTLSKITGDLDTFKASEDTHSQHALVHKRGYMFYGKPGCGKTSSVIAMASYLDYNIYVYSLNALDNTEYIRSFGQIPSGSIVLYEDVDAMLSSIQCRSEESELIDTGKGVTLATLLNVLDGVYSKDGIVTIMTTNYLDKLDSAITRPGRVDCLIEFTKLQREQCSEMFDLFIKECNETKQAFLDSFDYPVAGSLMQEALLIKLNLF
jgi:hypothetical protein